MGKPLTSDMIFQRLKTNKLDSIKNLNLWGHDLEDVSILNDLPNVEVLSLSVNKISTLKDFSNCKKLTELYLRKNLISNIAEVQYLVGLEKLRVLWLCDNPCANLPQYRPYIIHLLQNLEKLDNANVTPEEREASQNMNFANIEPLGKSSPERVENKSPPHQKAHEVHESPPQPKFEQNQPPPQHFYKEEEKIIKKKEPVKEKPSEKISGREEQPKIGNRNENIICAILSLLKELDSSSLEIIRKDINRKLGLK
jgi:hypothetical protein